MIQKIILPQLGQTMEEGTVEKWHKTEGDKVEKGEVLFDLTTDKATLEVESFAEGVLKKIVVQEGETVPVNELVAVVGEEEDEIPEDLGEIQKEGKGGETSEVEEGADGEEVSEVSADPGAASAGSKTGGGDGRIFISPRAKKIAAEKNLAPESLRGRGSGPNGRIVERDVREYIKQLESVKFTPAAMKVAASEGIDLLAVEAGDGDRIRKDDVFAAAEKQSALKEDGEIELSPMRQTIAQRMSQSKSSVPHFYMVGDVNMKGAMKRRKVLNEQQDVHITVTDMIVKATGMAVKKHPRINARFESGKLILNPDVNIGVAVAVEDGLFVPVVRHADNKCLESISEELKSLAGKAREGQLVPEEYEGGSVTVSNLGAFGIESFLPIINPPESCILGIGTVKEEIVVEEGAMRIQPVMKVSVSADHRITDGAAAAQFFNTFRDALENPEML